MLTQERLKELLSYDAETGEFTWKTKRGRTTNGVSAGTIHSSGYMIIQLDKTKYGAHRLAWLYCYGETPSNMVDHINRVKLDNRIANLRLASESENQMNSKLSRNNTSGYKGVSYNKKSKLWRVNIANKGRYIYIGQFKTPEEANIKAKQAREKLHGEFCSHG